MIVAGGALLGVSFAAWAGSQDFGECSEVSENLVKNCGFEQGCFSDWAVSTLTTTVESGEIAHSGDFGVKFDPGVAVGWIGQGVSTTPGQSYTLSFWLRSEAPNRFDLWWDDVIVYTVDLPATPYQQVVIDGLLASSDSAMFWFWFTSPTDYVYIDDIVVVPSE